MAGVYVHFPFCASRCVYCDFYSSVRKDWDAYIDAAVAEIARNGDFFKGVRPTTLYFGGGTPSLLPASSLGRVADAVRKTFGTDSFEEFTIEVNPDDVTPGSAAAWHDMGVTRVSMGVQSFDDSHLKWMRRRHSAADAVRAVRTLQDARIKDVSVDLIFGFVGLSDGQWADNVAQALDLRPQHISCYQMTGRYSHPSEELCYDQYMFLQRRLTEAGYMQYEVSNYCLPGHESRHNSGYWTREPYLGVGAAAHSFDGVNVRRWNIADMDRYIAGTAPIAETLTDEECIEEKLMLGLRICAGVSLDSIEASYRERMKPALEHLSKAGNIILCGSQIRIPSERLFISDWIIEQLFV